MQTDAFNHAPAQILMNTGSQQFGRPSMGSWVTYGLGSESQDLPGFVVFSTGKKGPSGGDSNWGSGFLPTVYQGVQFRGGGEPVLYLSNPRGIDRRTAARLARRHPHAEPACGSCDVGDPEIATRINSLRDGVPDADQRPGADGPEPRSRRQTLDMYGARAGQAVVRQQLPAGAAAGRARRALRAALPRSLGPARQPGRRTIKQNCHDTDQACAALVKDLKQRGLLDDTLVIWGGEFGRTPMVQGGNDGRDHHPNALHDVAGRRRRQAGPHARRDATNSASTSSHDPVHVHDLHATHPAPARPRPPAATYRSRDATRS